MSKITPGPWKATSHGEILSSQNYGVCGEVWSHCGIEEAKANAYAIAAVPEMLEFIESLIKTETNPLIVEHAKQVLRKARGGK